LAKHGARRDVQGRQQLQRVELTARGILELGLFEVFLEDQVPAACSGVVEAVALDGQGRAE
jgi:hypothetical protein